MQVFSSRIQINIPISVGLIRTGDDSIISLVVGLLVCAMVMFRESVSFREK